MSAPDPRIADEITAALGDAVTALTDAYGLPVADVAPADWTRALTAARDGLGCVFFDWLSAVDELDAGFAVCAHLVRPPAAGRPLLRVLIRTRVPREAAELPTATGVFAGASWHERETAEMFGITFAGHPYPETLLLPDGFEGHPLRKDFVLAARVAKPWPGAKEPGESEAGAAGAGARSPGRRRTLPPGVPDPAEWGPHKDELAAAAAAEAEAAGGPGAPGTPGRPGPPGAGRAGRAPGERPARGDRPRRMRSASGGSASQQAAEPSPSPSPEPEPEPERPAAAPSPSPERESERPAAPSPSPERGPERPAPERPAPGQTEPGQTEPRPDAPPPSGEGPDTDGGRPA